MSGKDAVLARIAELGVIPVVRAPSAEDALRRVDALQAGGLALAEITLTVPGAVDLIRVLARERGDVLVGAGSVIDAGAARACVEAGARFIVCPSLDLEIVAYCRAQHVAVMPGALTPTEIVAAWNGGADLVKVFPARALGGPDYVKALRGPLPQLALVPTGGVTLASVADYFRAGVTAVGAGNELVGAPDVAAAARAWLDAARAARPPERQAGTAV